MHMALFNLGFRPFFLLASIYAVASVLIWGLTYSGGIQPTFAFSSPMIWHAHEMIYGYAVAVIAGFLLTAVKNWTGVQTVHGLPLLLLALVWITARVMAFIPGEDLILWQAVIDNLFLVLLIICIAMPMLKAKLYKNMVIVTKILLIMASNIVFYLGVMEIIEGGERAGLYSGVYLIIALILTLGRRVIPMFIQGGVDYPVELKNNVWIDRGSLILFLFFWIADIAWPNGSIASILAGLLFMLHSVRLSGWYTAGIWKQPLLWVLFIGYCFLILGFFLKALAGFTNVSPFLSLHAFTYGGIGVMSMGMMARVTLGHTGRQIYAPSKMYFWMFLLLSTGAILRVIMPLLVPSHYLLWVNWSFLHWVIAFGLFVINFAPKLIQPRVDGKPG